MLLDRDHVLAILEQARADWDHVDSGAQAIDAVTVEIKKMDTKNLAAMNDGDITVPPPKVAPISYGELNPPSWREMLPMLLECLENSETTEERRTMAQKALERMAAAADAWNNHECE